MNNILYKPTTNEPAVHFLIRKPRRWNTFVFVPSAGMRLAPEILALEFYREVFFESHWGAIGSKDLNPDEVAEDRTPLYTLRERVVLHALRGRRRKSQNSKSKAFFAPSYYNLAKNGWLGKSRERVIVNFLLGGPIAQYLWHKGETIKKKLEQERIVDNLVRALIGQKIFDGVDPHGKDILSVALGADPFEVEEKIAIAKENLLRKTKSNAIMKVEHDELASRICHDLLALCELELKVPRMQWVHAFMTFLRFSLPMWLLAQMRITSILYRHLLDAIDSGKLADPRDIEEELTRRNHSLLHPRLSPTREIFELTERYMKHRVELNILLYNLEDVRKELLSGKRLETKGAGSGVLSVEQLLIIARDAADDLKSSKRFKAVAEGSNFKRFLTREAEQFAAWRDPLKKGQGKNIDEFFRVLYRDDLGDEAGGYLLIPKKYRRRIIGFNVFPGQLLLKTITFFAENDKKTRSVTSGGGKLVLEDVERHFQQYGIDFSCAADARPLLMQELKAMGLLSGSPDAGSSVAVGSPY